MTSFAEWFDSVMHSLAPLELDEMQDRAARDQAVEDILDSHPSPPSALGTLGAGDLSPLPAAVTAASGIGARVAQLVWLRVFQGLARPTVHDAAVAGDWLTNNGVSLEHQRWQSQTLGLRSRSYVQGWEQALEGARDANGPFAGWFYAGQLRAVFRFAELGQWVRSDPRFLSDPLNTSLGVGAKLADASDGARMHEDLVRAWADHAESITALYVLINCVFFAKPFRDQADLLISWSDQLIGRSESRVMDAYGWGSNGDGVVWGYRARGLVRKASTVNDIEQSAALFERAEQAVTTALERMPVGDPTTDLALFSEQFERERQSILLFRAAAERIGALEEAARRADRSVLTTVEIIGLFTAVIGFTFGSVNLLSGFETPGLGDRMAVLALFGLFMLAFAAVIVLAIQRMRSAR